eukprot:CAMPEP_0177372146 /NCGR_PEP_ID=MMETSP0368-20130122/42896_1 /TAXON_ID=447022 ORGANISM="Scrippsiella hangoei-like, Strain SHHI-4" /NCGR_SAMPLE_ID=MMETSP0368 /ASSEMBLY_ACC=CAM_ASM_000363 /LENGTH=142 /DNA_ID=CAMNT_0018835511 /DNA_START=253 /DNA_END=678 /DNA_ORIENTATION=-
MALTLRLLLSPLFGGALFLPLGRPCAAWSAASSGFGNNANTSRVMQLARRRFKPPQAPGDEASVWFDAMDNLCAPAGLRPSSPARTTLGNCNGEAACVPFRCEVACADGEPEGLPSSPVQARLGLQVRPGGESASVCLGSAA